MTERGLACEAGGFHIDPWGPVDRAVVTHAHADHTCKGCGHYLASREGSHVLRTRLGNEATIQLLEYGEAIDLNGYRLSLHPAGHILGSAQVRIEHRGHVTVFSGDYKRQPDPTCTPFELLRCHSFITESTFGLPVYRWDDPARVFEEIRAWWRSNQEAGRASVILAYVLGKAQSVLMGLDPSMGPVYTHSLVEEMNRRYRMSGVGLPNTLPVEKATKKSDFSRAIILAPPFGPRHNLDEAVRRVLDGPGLGLDAHPRDETPPRRRSRLRSLGPRGLARPDGDDCGNGGRRGPCHPRFCLPRRAHAPGERHRRQTAEGQVCSR